MGPMHGLMANFSVIYQYLVLRYCFWYIEKIVPASRKEVITMGTIHGLMANFSEICQYLVLTYCFI